MTSESQQQCLKPKQSTEEGSTPNLGRKRRAATDDLGVAVRELTVDDFYRTALPSLPPTLATNLNVIFTALTTGDKPVYCTKDSWWNDFIFTPRRNENTTYEAFAKIADSIVSAVQGVVKPCPEQFFDFVHVPNSAPKSLTRPTKHRPDGYFMRKRKEAKAEGHHWIDIGPTGEYKLHNSPSSRDDNTLKAVWNVNHTMREDIRRRRSWAFTVERATLRLWYFDRSVVIVSQAFNIMRNPERLVHFFLAFLYSEEGVVGWDPSIRRVWEPLGCSSTAPVDLAVGNPTAVDEDRPDSAFPSDDPSSDESESVYAEDSEESSSEDAHGDRWKAWKNARRDGKTLLASQATRSSNSRQKMVARSTRPGRHIQVETKEVVSEGHATEVVQRQMKGQSRPAVKSKATDSKVPAKSTTGGKMQAKPIPMRPQYIIDIHGTNGSVHHFKTVSILSNIGAEAIRGRGTRVWQAVRCHDAAGTKIADDGRLYAVKDCWIDQDRSMEGDTMQNILERARSYRREGKLTDTQVSTLERALLTVYTHGRTDSSNQTSITLDVRALDSYTLHYVLERDSPKTKLAAASASQKQQAAGDHRSPLVESESVPVSRLLRDYHTKFNYRITFAEVCMPLYKEIWLDQVFTHLSRVVEVLEILHCLGWVHRDISAGNILILRSHTGFGPDADYCVKLSDFEYAKDMFATDSMIHNIRTGTPDFMSIEVGSQGSPTWCFPPAPPKPSARTSRAAAARRLDPRTPVVELPPVNPRVQLPAWFYHPLNEMESVLWLGLFFTVNKGIIFRKKDNDYKLFLKSWADVVSPAGTPIDKDRINEQHQLACSLFRKPRGGRADFIKSDIAPLLHLPPTISGLIEDIFDECRVELVARYRQQEQNIPGINHTSAAGLYSGWRESFEALAHDVGSLAARVELRDLSDAQNEAEEYQRTTISQGKGLTTQMGQLSLHRRTVA